MKVSKYNMESTRHDLEVQKTPTLYMWCDGCYTWVGEVAVELLPCGGSWICCEACGNGLIQFQGERV